MKTEQHQIWPALDRFQRVVALAESGLYVPGGLFSTMYEPLEPCIEDIIKRLGGVTPDEMEETAKRLQEIADDTATVAKQLRDNARSIRATVERAEGLIASVSRQFSPERTVSVERRDAGGRIYCDCAAMWSKDTPTKSITRAMQYFKRLGIPVTTPACDGNPALQWSIQPTE